jgi:glycosyltransferase involved in cell wall biosynthesis
MLELASASDIGLMFVPLESRDINMQAMVGASNKSYEYMVCGLPQLVSPSPEWIAAIVEPGYGIASNPADAREIAHAVRKLHEDRGLRRTMAAAAHRRIADEWNYETEFAPVVERLERGRGGAAK